MKHDEPFYVGETNLFDYQRKTSYKRYNTLTAADVEAQTGMCPMKARRHVQQREFLNNLRCTLCGGTWHLAKDCRWKRS